MVEGLAVLDRVYIAEDSERLRRYITSCVEETGRFEIVGQAESASEAIKGIATLLPQLVVLDLQLIGGSGWDVMDAVRHLPVRFLILTNNNDAITRSAAAERGVTYFFDKTTQFDDFIDCLVSLPSGDE
jgi:DNA-binding NarL/FixJ family response regulator